MYRSGATTNEEVVIGAVGADEIVRRIMTVARERDNPPWRLVAATYDDEQDAHEQAMKIASRVDVLLFAGPLPYDVAAKAGGAPIPATHVPVGGSAFYGALLRGALQGIVDPLRVSVDTLTPEDVYAAYREIDLDPAQVHVQSYHGPDSGGDFVAFHRHLYEQGTTTGAVTTVPTVAAALADAGVPALKMTPSGETIRQALNTAALLGSGARMEESRIAVMIVRVPRPSIPAGTSPSAYWYQELRLALHRELLRDARPMDASVIARDEHSYLIIATMGSLAAATDGLTLAPFLSRASGELGMELELGIGLGRSAREAELNAETAVDRAAAAGTNTAYLIGPNDTVLELPGAPRAAGQPAPRPEATDPKAVEILSRLADRLEHSGESEVIDAETVAELLGVTLRTARRMLNTLVDAGLAWPMPPARTNRAGRPPRIYQLLIEKLNR